MDNQHRPQYVRPIFLTHNTTRQDMIFMKYAHKDGPDWPKNIVSNPPWFTGLIGKWKRDELVHSFFILYLVLNIRGDSKATPGGYSNDKLKRVVVMSSLSSSFCWFFETTHVYTAHCILKNAGGRFAHQLTHILSLSLSLSLSNQNGDLHEIGKETTTTTTTRTRPIPHQILLSKAIPYDYNKPCLHRYFPSHFFPLPTQALQSGNLLYFIHLTQLS